MTVQTRDQRLMTRGFFDLPAHPSRTGIGKDAIGDVADDNRPGADNGPGADPDAGQYDSAESQHRTAATATAISIRALARRCANWDRAP
jgi:hypothetical protein